MPLEQYVIGEIIGKGSYGEVTLARHKKDKKQVSGVYTSSRYTDQLLFCDSITAYVKVPATKNFIIIFCRLIYTYEGN